MNKQTYAFITILIILLCFSCQKSNPTSPAATPDVASTVYAIDTQIAQQQTAAMSLYTKTPTPTATLTATITNSPNTTLTAAAIGTSIAQQQTAVASIFTFTATPTVTVTGTFTGTVNVTLTEAVTLTFEAQTAIANGWTSTNTSTPTSSATPTSTVTSTSTPYAVYITGWGGNGGPQQSCIDYTRNRIYVTDNLNHHIFAYDTTSSNCGGLITYWNGGLLRPGSVGVDINTGNVFAADTSNNRVISFDMNGNSLNQWGTYGSGNSLYIPPQFNNPLGIFVDSITNTYPVIYVADTSNNRIQVFDQAGNCLSIWGPPENGDSFYNPRGICVGSNGRVYIADSSNNIIQVYDTNGNYIKQWGGTGTGDGQLKGPDAVCVDNTRGKVFVADEGNYRIQEFDLDGNYITQWGACSPRGISVDQTTGWVYVSQACGTPVTVYTVIY